MRARQAAVINTARNVQAFLDANAAIVGPSLDPARQNLDDAVAQQTALAAAQTGAIIDGTGATLRQRALRTTLRNNYMNPVSTVAKLALSDVPEIGSFQVKTKNLGSLQLVAAAHGMADAAAKYADVFIQHGLPVEFVARLRKAADAVAAGEAGRQALQGVTSGAVSSMVAQTSRVRNLLKLINALVVPQLGTNAVLLAQWKVARTIRPSAPLSLVPASVTAALSPSSNSSLTGIRVAVHEERPAAYRRWPFTHIAYATIHALRSMHPVKLGFVFSVSVTGRFTSCPY